MLSNEPLEYFRLIFFPPSSNVIIAHFPILVATRIRRSIEFLLNRRPLFPHSLDQLDKDLTFVIGPGSALEGMQLAQSMTVYRLDGSMRKSLGNFHPRPLEFGLVITFTTESSDGYLFHGTKVFDGLADNLTFFLGEFASELTGDTLSIAIFGPLVVTRYGWSIAVVVVVVIVVVCHF
jgi:hypothetical protein